MTGIEFLSSESMPNCVMVTTNDSRIRFINIKKGQVLLKIKGHKNENFMTRGSLSGDFAHSICASEDGSVYMWNNIEQLVLESSKRGLLGKIFKTNKLNEFEFFSMNQASAGSIKSQSLLQPRFDGTEDNSSQNSGQSRKT